MRQTFDDAADPTFGAKHLPLIRDQMVAQGLDGFLIPHEDEHQNEYLPDANERLAWATGFTGSAGAAVVMHDRAAVFSDGRYVLQLAAQTDGGAVEGGGGAEQRHRGEDLRHRQPAGDAATGQEAAGQSLDQLAGLDHPLAVVAVGGMAGGEDQDRGRHELHQPDHAERERAVG